MHAYDVVVVGAGVAGLSTALAAAPRRVLLVCRGQPGSDGSSAWAQGGIAAAIGDGDDPAQHAEDTIRAGSGHNHRDAVELLTACAPRTMQWLQAHGLQFDGGGAGPALGREGGHQHHRILHAGGDATGRLLMAALGEAVGRSTHVEVCSHAEVDGLLMRAESVCGVTAMLRGGIRIDVAARAVVLATGGIGGLYRYTTNPGCADGAGLALALAAGADGADLEFVQFHPTALAPAADCVGQRLPLVTEALRGAGALLVSASGRRLMSGRHPMQDLAPRDIVARVVWQAQANGERVFLDARSLGSSFALRFPTVHAFCAARGLDPASDLIPVVPAQHFHMGGVRVDLDGRSRVPGLHAVGEVACNGVHGANRLASNSLLEGAVFGRRLGAALASALPPMLDGEVRPVMLGAGAEPEALDRLRQLMWQHLGLLRDGSGLRAALRELAGAGLAGRWQTTLATAMTAAALSRTHSLGSHHRTDAARLARA